MVCLQDPETKEMVLESGALVLSDHGICCIDEFDKMSDNSRSMVRPSPDQFVGSTVHSTFEQHTDGPPIAAIQSSQ